MLCLALKLLCCRCLREPRAVKREHAVSVTCWLIVWYAPGGFGVRCKRESAMLGWHESSGVITHVKQVNGFGRLAVHVVRQTRWWPWNLVAALKFLCINVMNGWGDYENTYPHACKCLTFNLLSAARFQCNQPSRRSSAKFGQFLI